MTDTERRLADLLHAGTPEPPRTLTAADIAGLAHSSVGQKQRRLSRWTVPVLAAAAAVLAVAIPLVITQQDDGSPKTPAVQPSATHPAPSAVTPTTPVPTSASAPAGRPATCASGQLRLTTGRTEGAAGSIYTTVYLTNTGAQPCSMRGFPGVALLDPAGRVVGRPASRDGAAGPAVRVAPGHRAQFTLRAGVATRTGCLTPRPSSQIQVYPPDQTTPLRAPLSTQSCALSVSSVTAAG
ncbi:MAG: DUF4232 domain-containing protein [Actinomycetes bacterium]